MAKSQKTNGGLGYSLTSDYYTDPAIFAAERERIFFRTWQRVGHAEQAKAPGDSFTCDILGEPLIVVRGEDGALRAFRRDGGGRPLDGDNGDGAKTHLTGVRLELFCNFVYLNLDADAAAMADILPGVEDDIRSFLPDLDSLTFAHRTEATYDANWKVAVENYSECYHCELNHPLLMSGVLDAGGYRIETHERHQTHASTIQPDEKRSYDFDRGRTPRGGEFGAWYIWPNCSFQVYPGGYLNVFKWFPLAVGKTWNTVDWYLPSATPDRVERELIDQHAAYTFAEDKPLIDAVQKGLHSLGYDRGPLMVEDQITYRGEHTIAHIQSLVREALEG